MGTKSKKIITKYKLKNQLFDEEDYLKDCPQHDFVPTVLPPVKRVIAIGDIHGDLNLAIKSFKLANLIDDNYNWIANPSNTIVVQVGDQIDSCRPIPNVYDCHNQKKPNDRFEDISVLDFFEQMHIKASQKGGAVYSLLGNHELMNFQGKFPYVSYENFYSFKYHNEGQLYEGPNGRKKLFSVGGPYAKKIACDRKSVLVIGSTMFVHAGVLPVLARKIDGYNLDPNTKMQYLNAIVRKWLLNKMSDADSQKMIISDDKLSPFWTRVYGNIPTNTNLNSKECFDSVANVMEVLKIGHLVVGHTPQMFTNKSGINGTCYEKNGDHKLYRIDGGFSKAFQIFNKQGVVQVLEIIDDKYFNILTEDIVNQIEKPNIGISDEYMDDVSQIYSQNKISIKNTF